VRIFFYFEKKGKHHRLVVGKFCWDGTGRDLAVLIGQRRRRRRLLHRVHAAPPIRPARTEVKVAGLQLGIVKDGDLFWREFPSATSFDPGDVATKAWSSPLRVADLTLAGLFGAGWLA